MTGAALRVQVIETARTYLDRNDDDLLDLLTYEWERAGLAIADRGVGDYLSSVRARLLTTARRQGETVGVITALVADDALRWASDNGIASERYALVIGLLVSWVTRAALADEGPTEHPAPGCSNGEDSPPPPN